MIERYTLNALVAAGGGGSATATGTREGVSFVTAVVDEFTVDKKQQVQPMQLRNADGAAVIDIVGLLDSDRKISSSIPSPMLILQVLVQLFSEANALKTQKCCECFAQLKC